MKETTDYINNTSYIKIANKLKNYINKDTIIICIGTDKCIGDCLGPLVGSILKSKNFPLPVFGTLEFPIHALNIESNLKQIKKLYPTSFVIGIDACLGDKNTIGEIHIRDYPIHPGKGVGKKLPDVGNISIIGIVDSSENALTFANNGIRLHLVMEMAKKISKAFILSYYE